jgi:hypothetical protein
MTPEQAIALANARLRLQTQASQEQGNMYTQSAEDIQYSPDGIPLNTSSYGTAPTGVTKNAQQAFTSTVGLPLNMATGVAKAPAGLIQAYEKLIGGDQSNKTLSDLITGNQPKKPMGFGDNMVNIINQIEQGTQAQMGGAGQIASQVGSIAGQTAPFLAGSGIGQIPSFAQKVGTGVKVGALSGLATPEETGLNQQDFINAKGQNIALQGAMGGAFPVLGAGASKLADMVRGTKMSPQMNVAIENARKAGYTVPPTQAGGGVANRMLEGMAGKISTLQEASVRNQEITNKLATKSLGLAEDTVLTPEILGGIRTEAGKAYDAIASLPKKPSVLADSTMNRAAMPEIDPKKMVYDLRVARKEADNYYNAYARSADPEHLTKAKLAKTQASKLEDDLEQYAKDMGKSDLLPKLRDARQLIAKTYTVENAMNKTTGTIDAKEFAKRLQKGKPMSEELKQIAEFAQAFPKAAQKPEMIGGTIGISPLDYTVAGLTGGASLIGGSDKETTGAATLAALLARPAARKLVLSNPMQNRLIQQQSSPGAIKQALPSSQEAQQLAKILLMQSVAKEMQQGATNE